LPSLAGLGTSTHLAAEYLIGLAGVRVGVGLVKEGKLNPLGVFTASRADVLPDVATLAEQGLPGYEVTLWFGMWTPAGTPGAVVQKLNAAVNAIVFEPQVREQFARLGIQPAP
jgi:tripartite-type tricarboxylate transporter receptor subunit TctC